MSYLEHFPAFQCFLSCSEISQVWLFFYYLFHQLNLRPDPTHLPMYLEVQQLVKRTAIFL